MGTDKHGLLLGITTPIFRDADGRMQMELQTVSGLYAWRQHFDKMTVFTICHDQRPAPQGWTMIDHGQMAADGITIVPLPDTYNRRIYLQKRREVADQLRVLMEQADYCTFGYGGWIGDPGEIAAATARQHAIPHAVWLDRVESQVVRSEGGNGLKNRMKTAVRATVIAYNERRSVRAADLALLHGATVFDHFKDCARNPHQVDDIHFTEDDRADPAFVADKADAADQGPLRILYCGRASPMKGGIDWLRVLVGLKQRGIAFTARWLGEGELLNDMRAFAATEGLTSEDLTLEGFVADRQIVRQAYRDAHLQLFCHQTDESPRNLIESLHSATPLIGYRDFFAAELVDEKGAGLLVPRGQVDQLVDAVAGLDGDRAQLAQMIRNAGDSAAHLTREQVFRHRSEIIRRELPLMRHAGV
ncbi:glycosyltransferase [Paracoccus sp. M683]|uniref:glycosyltransferase n=1 Tax=Paracoccus sp. M683 TaxID=2594268 RepID=UPI00117C0186|nr:glycosyltransferase [Paracoccus sp. M683]TRW92143.1 glycosyltransferase [Paracoccus sp. M683]